MTELVAWLLFPAVVVLLGLGCGLLVERASGRRLPGVLLVPVGLALIAVLSDLLTRADATAEATAPVIVLVALAGVGLSLPRLRALRIDPWAAGAALLAFAALLAPVVSSGSATFTGYTILDDSSVHFSLLEQVFERGHASLPGGTEFSETVASYLATGYPLGSYLPLGVGWKLVGGEVAWLFQPWLGILLASVALAVYGLLQGTGLRRWQRALVAGLTAQPGLLYAYALQGSVKEIATLGVFTLIVALASVFLREPPSARATVPLAVTTAAGLSVLSLAVLPWIGIPLAAVAALALGRARRGERRAPVRALGVGAVLTALLAAPALSGAVNFTKVATGVLQKGGSLGNLARQPDPLQLAGIWPRGDYRLALVRDEALVYLLIALTLLAAAGGLVWLARRRTADGPLLMAVGGAIAAAYLLFRGAPYADGKTLAIGSPVVTLLALLGALALVNGHRRLPRVTGAVLAAAVAGGILWTNALAYRDTTMAPKERFDELLSLDDRLAGDGPTLFAEYDAYAGYLLRRAGGVGSHRYRDAAATAKETMRKQARDLDRTDWRYLTSFPRIVQRRSPLASRPPSNYRLEWSGRYYEAWRRVDGAPRIVTHEPVGTAVTGEPRIPCGRIEALARRASESGGELRYAERPQLTLFAPARAPVRPRYWRPEPLDPAALHAAGAGVLRGPVYPRTAGRYRVWLGGSFGRGIEARLDRRRVGSVGYELGWAGQFFELGTAQVAAGARSVELEHPAGSARGGDGYQGGLVSYLVLAPLELDRRVRSIRPGQARRLCSRALDWVEVVARERAVRR